jgi:hypothetical protein
LSPQSRHGRGSAGRRSRHRQDAGRHAAGIPAQKPAAAPGVTPSQAAASEPPEEISEATGAASPTADEKRIKPAPLKKRKRHGTLYRWAAAYLPLLAILFGLLAVVWVWVSFISPPPPTPAQRWQQIEDTWAPARERAREDLGAHGADFSAQLLDYKAFYDATKGWLDDVRAYPDWAKANTNDATPSYDVQVFLQDGQNYLDLLEKAYTAKTPEDILTMEETLPAADAAWETDRALVRVALGLTAVPMPSELPLPSAACIPVSSGSPGASTSPLASGSPGASESLGPTLPPCPVVTPEPSPS